MKWNFLYQITAASRTTDQGATARRTPFSVSSVLNWICWPPSPPRTKFLGTPLLGREADDLITSKYVYIPETKKNKQTKQPRRCNKRTNLRLILWNLFIDLNTAFDNSPFLLSLFLSFTPYWCTWSYWMPHTHIFDRTPLDEGSFHHRNLHVYNIHKRQRAMLPSGVEPSVWASDMPQTYALERAVTGMGACDSVSRNKLRTLGVEHWKTK